VQERTILNAGDIIKIQPSLDSYQVYFQVIEFDPLPLAPKGIAINGLTTGENTIYTCPSGYKAIIVHPFGSRSLTLADIPNVYVLNRSGGPATVYLSVVRSGGSPTSENRVIINTTITIVNVGTLACPAILNAGDFLSLNSTATSTSMLAYLSVIEIPV
jgi:hypothetical protein